MNDIFQGSEAAASEGPSESNESTTISQEFHEWAELIGRKIAERWRVRNQSASKEPPGL